MAMAAMRTQMPGALISASSSSSPSSPTSSARFCLVKAANRKKMVLETMAVSEEVESRPPVERYVYLKDGKLDKFHRLRTPRAARELALSVLYAAAMTQVQPMKILEDRRRAAKESVAKEILDAYDHAPRGGQPIYIKSEARARQVEQEQEEEAEIDAAVLTAHPYVVHNKFVLSLAEKIIKATSARWQEQEPVVKSLLPWHWKKDESGRLLEAIILHMSIAEIQVVGTSPNIVINEAVEISKRFCDGFAPRVLNGCLGSYFRSRQPCPSGLSPITEELQRDLSRSIYQSIGWNDEYLD